MKAAFLFRNIKPIALSLLMMDVLSSCAHSESVPATDSAVSDFYPMGVGLTWTYRVVTPAGKSERAISIRSEKDGVFLTDAGSFLFARTRAVHDGARILIQEPLEVGHSWLVVPNAQDVEKYEIVATQFEKHVPGGSFKNCLQVSIQQKVRSPTGERGVLKGLWTYAPEVGPIHFRQVLSTETEEVPLIEYSLLRFETLSKTNVRRGSQSLIGPRESRETILAKGG